MGRPSKRHCAEAFVDIAAVHSGDDTSEGSSDEDDIPLSSPDSSSSDSCDAAPQHVSPKKSFMVSFFFEKHMCVWEKKRRGVR